MDEEKKKELKFGLVLGFLKRRKELLTALGNKIFPFFLFGVEIIKLATLYLYIELKSKRNKIK